MKFEGLSIPEAESEYNRYKEERKVECPQAYEGLRKDICSSFYDTLNKLGISEDDASKNAYRIDCDFGLDFYGLMNSRYEMTPRTAADDDIWRYISLCVVPDLVTRRYGIDSPDRYYKKGNRIWLKACWWYIHLSWQGSREATLAAIKENSTDTILQLVDRSGKDGYRVDLYREIIGQYSRLKTSDRNMDNFRKVMVLNTAKVRVIEPALTDGGEKAYIGKLFDSILTG